MNGRAIKFSAYTAWHIHTYWNGELDSTFTTMWGTYARWSEPDSPQLTMIEAGTWTARKL